MQRMSAFLLFAVLASTPAPGPADVSGFALVNGTDADLSAVAIRRHGTQDWKPLVPAARPGERKPVTFSDPDCAFDLQAEVAGKPVTWTGVNLCETRAVTLRRDDSGALWVDYD